MKTYLSFAPAFLSIVAILISSSFSVDHQIKNKKMSIHEFKVESISGESYDFSNLKGKKILDYGCGDGEVLCLAKLAGAQVYGIEFGDTPEQLSKDLGLDIKSYPPSSWIGNMDYVRSFHSYEHITDPIEVLEQFKSLVTPISGRILIGVPNVDSWTASIFGKYYFYFLSSLVYILLLTVLLL